MPVHKQPVSTRWYVSYRRNDGRKFLVMDRSTGKAVKAYRFRNQAVERIAQLELEERRRAI